MRHICIYHKGCSDGFGAAWAMKQYFDSIEVVGEFVAGVYGEDTPNVDNANVFLVDFSYPRAVLSKLLASCNTLTILDHHDTAIVDVKQWLLEEFWQEIGTSEVRFSTNKLSINMTNAYSGAMLAWNYFSASQHVKKYGTLIDWFPGNAPSLLQHIQDRDLWEFELPGTKEIIAALYSYPFDFEFFSYHVNDTRELYEVGTHILRAHNNTVANLLKQPYRTIVLDGVEGPVMNVLPQYASDVGNSLSKDFPFSVTYVDTDIKRIFSLRSNKENPNAIHVGELAKKFGGGGHKHASGFSISLDSAHPMEQ